VGLAQGLRLARALKEATMGLLGGFGTQGRRRLRHALLAVAGALWASHAVAETRAEELFREGRKLMDEGKIADACQRFAESQRLEPAPGTLLNLADCYEQNYQSASAWAAYKQVAQLADPKRAEWRQLATERAAALEAGLCMLTVVVADDAADVELKRDGVVVPRDERGRPVPVDPGTHVISAAAPKKKAWSQTIELRGTGASVRVDVPSLAADAPDVATSIPQAGALPPQPPQPPDAAATTQSSNRRRLGLVVGGAGVAVLTFGSVAGVIAIGKRGDARDKCPDYPTRCTQEGADANSQAKTWATISTVTVAAGLVGAGVGAFLFFTSKDDGARSASVTPWLGPTSAGLRGVF
jgi:hypothetical protein